MGSDESRVTALEHRVAALEAALAHGAAAAGDDSGPPGADDTFWALTGLQDRAPGRGGVMLVGAVTLPDGREARWQEGASTDDLLDGDWAEVSDVLAALAHPARLRLLRLVLAGTTSAASLTEAVGEGTTGRTYHHLRQLVAAGWLRTVGQGRYEVPVARVVPLLVTLAGARR